MEDTIQISSQVASAAIAWDFDNDPLIDHQCSKGMPKGMFVGKDGVVYGFDEEKNRRELAKSEQKIDRKKLRAMAKRLMPIQCELERTNPDL